MSADKFVQPDHTTKAPDAAGARDWMGEIESAVSVLNSSSLGDFALYASDPVSMAVNVAPGILSNSLGIKANSASGGASEGTSVVSAGVQSVPLMAPTQNPRIDRICVDVLSGQVKAVAGVEAVTPIAPKYPDGAIPIGAVLLAVGQVAITNAHITDERNLVSADSPTAISGDVTAFPESFYALITTPGTYNISKPTKANYYKVSLGGGGGGGGGRYTSAYGGGGGGGGGMISGAILTAEDLVVIVGAPGNSGVQGAPGIDGTAGGASSITGVSSGIVLTANGGGKGLKGGSAAGGAGGAGGTVTPSGLGIAGGDGGTGGALQIPGFPGVAGEQRLTIGLSAGGTGVGPGPTLTGSGFVLIEWF